MILLSVFSSKCWVYHLEPDTKWQIMQWKHLAFPAPKKARVKPSAGKVKASVFWDAKGTVLIDYIWRGKIINAKHYVNLRRQLPKATKSKQPEK